jgi:Na+/H+ antiporter NhaD/arsenite permease-like protein
MLFPLQSVEWDMLLFFAAQFVMVECAAEIGMIDMIGGWLESIIRSAPAQQRTLVAVQILLWASAAISGILVSSDLLLVTATGKTAAVAEC